MLVHRESSDCCEILSSIKQSLPEHKANLACCCEVALYKYSLAEIK